MMTINMTRFNKQPKISFSDSRIVKSSAKNKKQIPIKPTWDKCILKSRFFITMFLENIVLSGYISINKYFNDLYNFYT